MSPKTYLPPTNTVIALLLMRLVVTKMEALWVVMAKVLSIAVTQPLMSMFRVLRGLRPMSSFRTKLLRIMHQLQAISATKLLQG